MRFDAALRSLFGGITLGLATTRPQSAHFHLLGTAFFTLKVRVEGSGRRRIDVLLHYAKVFLESSMIENLSQRIWIERRRCRSRINRSWDKYSKSWDVQRMPRGYH